MALPNPAINPPHLPYPGQQASLSRCPSNSPPSGSPTRSSARRLQSISDDPLLRDLSPTKTLKAISGSSTSRLESVLMKSVEHASDSDKAFGARVAQACKDLREWTTEVEAWEWPGTFAPPATRKDRKSKRRRMLADYHVDSSFFQDDSDGDEGGFWGSLPKELVQAYEMRIEQIQQAMVGLDVEGLKSHVRSVHILPKHSKDQSRDEYVSFRVRSMDDFTALITATILQALPYMTWLNRLLNEWSIRLVVLRKVPGFLHGLVDTQKQLDSAWTELAPDRHNSQEAVGPVRGRIEGLQTVLGSKVSALGQRLDNMLDELEGRPESLPDRWIDDFEALELAYSTWVVKAERTVTGLAWEFDLPTSVKGTSIMGPLTPTYEGLGFITDSDVKAHAVHGGPAIFNASSPSLASERRVESPTLGQFPFGRQEREQSIATSRATSFRGRANSEFGRVVDDAVSESLPRPQENGASEPNTIDFASMSRNRVAPPPVPQDDRATRGPPSPSKSSRSPGPRSRHVPIDVDPYREAALLASIAQMNEKAEEPVSFNREPPLPLPQEDEVPVGSRSIAARRALFNGDLENKQILLRTQSPVRPFEHASTAFTKLFKSSTSREPSRSRSSTGKATLKKKSRSSSVKRQAVGTANRTSDLSFGATNSNTESDGRNHDSVMSDGPRTSLGYERSMKRDFSFDIDRLASSAHEQRDWSDKVVVAGPRPASEGDESPDVGRANRFDSPLTPAQGSEYWPLPVNAVLAQEEISNPSQAIRSDAFEQMFVDTLPVSPVLYDDESFASNLAAFETYVQQIRSKNKMTDVMLDPTMDPMSDAMLDGVYTHAIDDIKTRKARRSKTEGGRKRRHHRHQSEDVSSARSFDAPSMLRSPTSTPEIQEASTIGFARPQEIHSPRRVRKHKSRRNKDALKSSSSFEKSYSSVKPRLYLNIDSDADRSGSEKETNVLPRTAYERPSRVRAAPSAAHERPDTGNGHDEPIDVAPEQSEEPTIEQFPHKHRERSDTTQSEPVFPLPPTSRGPSHLRSRSVKDTQTMLQALRSDSERSFVGNSLGAVKPLPLAVAGSSQLDSPRSLERIDSERFEDAKEEQVASETDRVQPKTPAKSEKRRESVSSSNGDYMDQHVNKVLKKMTSNVRFSTSEIPRPKQGTQPLHHFEAQDGSGEEGSQEGLTIRPAQASEPSLKQHLKDGETKLYHLQQPGRSQPIKLFVRLVGVDERVMVRVGGGWMDLEEYLRQYAEHHTHRAMRSGPVEVTEASRVSGSDKKKSPDSQRALEPSPTLDQKTFTSKDGRTSTHDETLQALPDGSGPANGQLESRTNAFPLSESRSTSDESTSRPQRVHRHEPLRSNPLFPAITNPQTNTRPMSLQTPSGSKPGPSLFPKIAESQQQRPTSLQAPPSSAVGSSGVRAGLDAQKARWVEMMLDRARSSTSAEKNAARVSRASWQSLGSGGQGKRLAMRSASGDTKVE
ncbi:hypothetical protein K461DRAFT_264319 [Myriangium duriaei CBS 260.36]|uniref:GAR domain-containing protein n=1 Tax=Myriangium duriaei CBS 260.36 TaxID=1168546 RepID=A0A9P4MPM9_9PEZI|nr:hypothetical protein K461DRAFT_264319 [Myriangium duriaei CBS 260.36]